MAIPAFRDDGWLPDGHHSATWEEVIAVCSGQPDSRREHVMHALLDWRDQARQKGISGRLILHGSFISTRENPGDFDALLIYDEDNDRQVERRVGSAIMITDLTQLQIAFHQLTAFEDMLAAMRRHLEETHPPLLPLMSEGYLQRIHALQTEILTYLRERPTDVPWHEKTVRGKLIAINVEENTCTIHPENAAPVECAYEETLEDHLIAALRQEVEVAGQFIPLEWLSRRYRITRMQRTGLLRQEDTVEASG